MNDRNKTTYIDNCRIFCQLAQRRCHSAIMSKSPIHSFSGTDLIGGQADLCFKRFHDEKIGQTCIVMLMERYGGTSRRVDAREQCTSIVACAITNVIMFFPVRFRFEQQIRAVIVHCKFAHTSGTDTLAGNLFRRSSQPRR